MDQVVSRRPFTAEIRVRTRVSPCGTYDDQNYTGIGLSQSPSVFHCQYHPTMAVHVSSWDEQLAR
jgi:hypothetical protein